MPDASSLPHAPSYTKMTADVYDTIYSKKDYKSEAAKLKQIIAGYKKSQGKKLLDVACGTGLHLVYLVDEYEITGLDLSKQQIQAAKHRFPKLKFVQADMRDFSLNERFDIVTCLFSSIGYAHPFSEMKRAIRNMGDHLVPGGVLIVEPWLVPSAFDPKRPPATQVVGSVENGLKVTRTSYTSQEGNISVLKMHHVIERPSGKEEFTEEHRMALYSKYEYEAAFKEAGLDVSYHEEGLSGRGLYIGTKR